MDGLQLSKEVTDSLEGFSCMRRVEYKHMHVDADNHEWSVHWVTGPTASFFTQIMQTFFKKKKLLFDDL